MTTISKISACWWFDGNAEQAAKFYAAMEPCSTTSIMASSTEMMVAGRIWRETQHLR